VALAVVAVVLGSDLTVFTSRDGGCGRGVSWGSRSISGGCGSRWVRRGAGSGLFRMLLPVPVVSLATAVALAVVAVVLGSDLTVFTSGDWGCGRGVSGGSRSISGGCGSGWVRRGAGSGLFGMLLPVPVVSLATAVALAVVAVVLGSNFTVFTSRDGGCGRGVSGGSRSVSGGCGSGWIRRGASSGLFGMLLPVPVVSLATAVSLAVVAVVLGGDLIAFTSSDHIGNLARNLLESLSVSKLTDVVLDGLLTSLQLHIDITGEERVRLFVVVSKNTGRSNDNSGKERGGCRETHSDSV